MKIAIINYGMGNLSSVRRCFEDLGADISIANMPSDLYEADRIILPGVGAFSEGMEHLHKGDWIPALYDIVKIKKKPLLGICLGMQMLATKGYGGIETSGLNFISGEVKRIDLLGCNERIPHMGWNEVYHKSKNLIFDNIPDGSDFYFVHSYAFVIARDNLFATQFHPEKSSKAGRQMLRNFMSYSAC